MSRTFLIFVSIFMQYACSEAFFQRSPSSKEPENETQESEIEKDVVDNDNEYDQAAEPTRRPTPPSSSPSPTPTYNPPPPTGSGYCNYTSTKPYKVYTEADLKNLQHTKMFKTGGSDFNSVLLMNDIVLNGDFEPIANLIGPEAVGLKFDGQGFTIHNLRIVKPGQDNVGLFPRLAASCIKNVSFANVHVEGKSYVGVFTGDFGGDINSVKILSGKIIATGDYVGGFAGENNSAGDVSQSEAKIEVEAGTGSYIGGMFGDLSGIKKVIDIKVDTKITVSGQGQSVGGLAGKMSGSINMGKVTLKTEMTVANGRDVGPLAGEYQSVKGSEVTASGYITGMAQYVGGFLGSYSGGAELNQSISSVNLEGKAPVKPIGNGIGSSGFTGTVHTGTIVEH